MTVQEMEHEVLKKVSIPTYVYEIIVPNMKDYYSGNYPVDFENSRYMKCCFHDEDTPSMRWYEETNTFYCFGCGKGGPGERGNVISMHIEFMLKLNGTKPTKAEAIIFLYKYFVEGNDTSNVVHTSIEKKRLNSDADVARVNMSRTSYERAVLADRKVSLLNKVRFWDKMDEIDLLLSLDNVSADECQAEINKALKDIV